MWKYPTKPWFVWVCLICLICFFSIDLTLWYVCITDWLMNSACRKTHMGIDNGFSKMYLWSPGKPKLGVHRLKIHWKNQGTSQDILSKLKSWTIHHKHTYIYTYITHGIMSISSGFPQKDVISQPTSLDSLKDKQRYQRKKLQILQDLLQKALHPFHPFTYAGSFERLTTRPRTKEAWTGWSFSNDGMWLMMDRNVWI
jgi:hypothetical protein